MLFVGSAEKKPGKGNNIQIEKQLKRWVEIVNCKEITVKKPRLMVLVSIQYVLIEMETIMVSWICLLKVSLVLVCALSVACFDWGSDKKKRFTNMTTGNLSCLYRLRWRVPFKCFNYAIASKIITQLHVKQYNVLWKTATIFTYKHCYSTSLQFLNHTGHSMCYFGNYKF